MALLVFVQLMALLDFEQLNTDVCFEQPMALLVFVQLMALLDFEQLNTDVCFEQLMALLDFEQLNMDCASSSSWRCWSSCSS